MLLFEFLDEIFVEFLMFDGWNVVRGIGNLFYDRLLPAYCKFIYHS